MQMTRTMEEIQQLLDREMLIQMHFTVSFYKYFFGMYVGLIGLFINLGVIGLITVIMYLTKSIKNEGTIDNNDLIAK